MTAPVAPLPDDADDVATSLIKAVYKNLMVAPNGLLNSVAAALIAAERRGREIAVAQQARIAALEAALREIKDLVTGDRAPCWHTQNQTTFTRCQIADIIDAALAASPSKEATP